MNEPKLRHGERQGDLFCRQTEDITLEVQTGPDHQARQAAAEQHERNLAAELSKTALLPAAEITLPRKRHSHRCLRCGGNAVYCYKAQCTKPQRVETCKYCR